jgi:hypothetical protein
MASVANGLRFQESAFVVAHRRREYGPFDYDWSKDYHGLELLYQGQKFGEYCSPGEIHADLKEFRLPMNVVEVASIVLGSMVCDILAGCGETARMETLLRRLREMGHEKYARLLDESDES